jgi:hypothetical protein
MKALLHRAAYKLLGERVVAWSDLKVRRRLEPLRRDGLLLSVTDATLATLRLHGLLPSPLVALETFGKFGLRKTLDYIGLCESLDFYEVVPGFARLARHFLPPVARIHCEDTIVAIREGRLPRRDYNFVMIDNGFGIFGPGYCEHFDLFPHLYGYLAPVAVIVANVLLVHRVVDDDPAVVARRRSFFGASSDAEAMAPPFGLVVDAYRRRLPNSKEIQQAMAVPHPVNPARPDEEVYFLVLVIRSRRESPV